MKLTIPIDTPPQGRPRFYNGRAYDPPASKKFKADFGLILISMLGNHEKFTGEVKVNLRIYRNRKSAISSQFGDVDNLAKIILDAITETGAVWIDDRQVTELTVAKATAPNPSVELTIEKLAR